MHVHFMLASVQLPPQSCLCVPVEGCVGTQAATTESQAQEVGEAWEQRSTEKMLQGKFDEMSLSSRGEMQLQQEVERDFPEGTTELGKSAGKMFESGGVSQPG